MPAYGTEVAWVRRPIEGSCVVDMEQARSGRLKQPEFLRSIPRGCRASVGARDGERVAAVIGLTPRLNLPIGRRVAGSRLARDEQRAQISTETRGHWDVGLSLFGANG